MGFPGGGLGVVYGHVGRPRVEIADVPHHVTQCGNHRRDVFADGAGQMKAGPKTKETIQKGIAVVPVPRITILLRVAG